jgi:hypothetical protein
MNDGSHDDRLSRFTSTWNDPLAASYLLSALIDLSTTGELRSVVVSANGLVKCGSSCTAESASTIAMPTTAMTTTMAVNRRNRPIRRSSPRRRFVGHCGPARSGRSILTVLVLSGSIMDLRACR